MTENRIEPGDFDSTTSALREDVRSLAELKELLRAET